jgi:uncharacterized protein (TIGR02594 family)
MNVTALSVALKYLDTREREGAADNPFIRAWLMQAGFGPDAHDEIPWCASFVNHIAWLLGLPRPKLPARARSWLTVGVPVSLAAARPEWDVVILKRGGGDQPGPEVIDAQGHVGFFTSYTLPDVFMLGGNQGDAVNVQRFPESRVLGVRRLIS